MSYFDIQGYEPHWLVGLSATTTRHGQRLQALTGRRPHRTWLLWDLDTDAWFADGPVLLDFDGEQIEINHQKFGDLSITWNTTDPPEQTTWTYGDEGHPDDHVFHLGWRHDTRSELTALQGQPLQAVELLEYAGGDMADGMIAVSFAFADARVTISNALDENGLEFDGPSPRYHRHPVLR